MKEKAKYLLIAHTEDRELIIYTLDSYEARRTKTEEEMGSKLTEHEEDELREEGILSFDGDPPIEWRRGYICPMGTQSKEK